MILKTLKHILKKCYLFTVYLFLSDTLIHFIALCRKKCYFRRLNKTITHAHVSRNLQILVVLNRGGIGNIIEATPFIQALRMYYSSGVIHLLTSTADLFEQWCIPDYLLTNLTELEKKQFDYTFFPYWEWRSIPEWLQNIKLGKIIMPNKMYGNYFLKPEKAVYMDMAKKIGYRGLIPPLYVSMKHPSIQIAARDSYICLVPGGKREKQWRFKKWPYYNYLACFLSEIYPNRPIYIIGTKEDVMEFEPLPNLLDLRGSLSLSETAWVLKNAACAVGNDCGPMHIASAVNTPSIVIFGQTCILKNTYSEKTIILYPKSLDCWPCQYNPKHLENCTTGMCIKSTAPENVLSEINKLLKKTTSV